MTFDNPFRAEGIWLKGNLHTHTTLSDGDSTPQDRVNGYREHGYDFLSITDHDCVADPAMVEPGDLLLIPGIELVCANPVGGPPYHIVGIDVPVDFDPPEARGATETLAAIHAGGGLAFVCHPYWCGQTVRDLEALDGVAGVEVFNTDCLRSIGKGLSAAHWDQMLALGRHWLGFAVDDAHHHPRDTYQGWVVAKCAERTKEAVVEALRLGHFYASTGPTFESLEFDGERVTVRTSPAAYISFIADGSKGGHAFQKDGTPITEATYPLCGAETYLRIECASPTGETAWTNPLFVR
jgi:hypothetical protein